MNQFWKTIVPVKGEPIPEGAEANVYSNVWAKSTLIRPGLTEFIPDDLKYGWRVPVECVPIEEVAELIVENRTVDHYKRLWSLNMCAKTVPELRERVLTTLRELAAESVTT